LDVPAALPIWGFEKVDFNFFQNLSVNTPPPIPAIVLIFGAANHLLHEV